MCLIHSETKFTKPSRMPCLQPKCSEMLLSNLKNLIFTQISVICMVFIKAYVYGTAFNYKTIWRSGFIRQWQSLANSLRSFYVWPYLFCDENGITPCWGGRCCACQAFIGPMKNQWNCSECRLKIKYTAGCYGIEQLSDINFHQNARISLLILIYWQTISVLKSMKLSNDSPKLCNFFESITHYPCMA